MSKIEQLQKIIEDIYKVYSEEEMDAAYECRKAVGILNLDKLQTAALDLACAIEDIEDAIDNLVKDEKPSYDPDYHYDIAKEEAAQ